MIVKCLSVKQPWASLIAKGYKDIENRTWKTDYTGELYIHASVSFDQYGYKLLDDCDQFNYITMTPDFFKENLLMGGLIGKVDLFGITRNSKTTWAIDGQYHWLLLNNKTIPFIEVPGQRKIFEINLCDKCKGEGGWREIYKKENFDKICPVCKGKGIQ